MQPARTRVLIAFQRILTSCPKICASAPALRPIVGKLLFGKRANGPAVVDSRLADSQLEIISPTHSTQMSHEQKVPNYGSQAEMFYCRTFDVEGITTEGYGYTVTITAGNGGSNWRNKISKAPRQGEMAGESNRGRSVGWLGYLPRFWSRREPPSPRNRQASTSGNSGMEIFTRTSLDVEENFRNNPSRDSWGPQNPYSAGTGAVNQSSNSIL